MSNNSIAPNTDNDLVQVSFLTTKGLHKQVKQLNLDTDIPIKDIQAEIYRLGLESYLKELSTKK